jgi:hypothetical protein
MYIGPRFTLQALQKDSHFDDHRGLIRDALDKPHSELPGPGNLNKKAKKNNEKI